MKRATTSVKVRWWLSALYVVLFGVIAVLSYKDPSYDFNGSGHLLLAALLGVILTIMWRGQTVSRTDFALPAGLIALGLACFPDTSRDPMRFLLDGEMLRLWNMSPFIHPPGDLPHSQYSQLFLGHWQERVSSPYGPIWQLCMLTINFFSDNRLALGIAGLKLLNLAGLLVASRYLYLITRRPLISFMFLINPIVLLNTVAAPHPDILIAAGLLAAYHYRAAAIKGALVGLVALIKIHAAIMMPFFVRSWGEFWRGLAGFGVAFSAVFFGLMPFLGYSFQDMILAGHGGSVFGMESLLMRSFLPTAEPEVVFAASYGLFFACYGLIAVAFLCKKLSVLGALTATSFLVPLCLTGVLLPWHFIIPFVFLLLSERREALWIVLFLTLLMLRSAAMVLELIAMAGLFFGSGLVMREIYRRADRKPRWLTYLAQQLR